MAQLDQLFPFLQVIDVNDGNKLIPFISSVAHLLIALMIHDNRFSRGIIYWILRIVFNVQPLLSLRQIFHAELTESQVSVFICQRVASEDFLEFSCCIKSLNKYLKISWLLFEHFSTTFSYFLCPFAILQLKFSFPSHSILFIFE